MIVWVITSLAEFPSKISGAYPRDPKPRLLTLSWRDLLNESRGSFYRKAENQLCVSSKFGHLARQVRAKPTPVGSGTLSQVSEGTTWPSHEGPKSRVTPLHVEFREIFLLALFLCLPLCSLPCGGKHQ